MEASINFITIENQSKTTLNNTKIITQFIDVNHESGKG